MKKTLFALVVSAVALTFALPSFADEAKPKAKIAHHDMTGDIKALDATAHTLTLVNKEGLEKAFVLGDKVKVATADKPKGAELSDIKVGEKVKVTYTDVDGKLTVSRISPPEAPHKKADAPAPAPAKAP